MVSLADRLEPILGAKAARGLEEAFGIRTVEDLLRHYPRKYSQGSKVLGAEDAPPGEPSLGPLTGLCRWDNSTESAAPGNPQGAGSRGERVPISPCLPDR